MRIVGVDILAGSVNAKTQPKYSVVLLESGKIAFRGEMNKAKLNRFIKDVKPERVACDNVFEIFSKDSTRRFFFHLPPNTKLVQVNVSLGKRGDFDIEPLHIVAKKNGIPLTSKATSAEEAEACAKLAYRNVGCAVEAFKDECRIIVSRARSIGRGGQSEQRYRRKVHGMVAMNVKEIKSKLDGAKIKYRLECAKADYGYSRGEFRVYCPREELKVVREHRGSDVQIKILPVERDKLSFTPLVSESKSVIVGIDPGLTVAIAVLDLAGNICEVFSARNFSVEDVISFLNKYSNVLVVATDVFPAPKFLEKVSSSLDSVLFAPEQSLSVAEKIQLAFGKYKNPHERDAIAAGVKAYKNYRNKLEQIDKRLQEAGMQKFESEVKKRVLKGESIDKVIKLIAKPHLKHEDKEKEKLEAVPDEYRGIIKTLRDEIQTLKSEREELKKILEYKEYKILEFERKLDETKTEEFRKIKKEREIEIRDKEIQNLKSEILEERQKREEIQKELEELKRAQSIDSERFAAVKIIPQFTREEVSRAKTNIKEGDVVYILDSSVGGKTAAEELIALKPRALIADKNKMSHLAIEALKDAIVMPPNELNIKIFENFGIVERDALESAIKREYGKKKEIKNEAEWLEKFIEEYKKEREKS